MKVLRELAVRAGGAILILLSLTIILGITYLIAYGLTGAH